MDVRTVINTPIARVKVNYLKSFHFKIYFSINLFLKFQFLTLFHFTLLVGALQGHWLSQAYLFYNILFMVTLFWAIHCRESTDAVIFVSTYYTSVIPKHSFFVYTQILSI